MANDAKLGLVAGLVLVLTMGLVFFRKEAASAGPDEGNPAATANPAPGAPPLEPVIPPLDPVVPAPEPLP